MKLIAVLATCWVAAALAILLEACWPAGVAGPDPFCAAALVWAVRERGAVSVLCGGLLGLMNDLSGSSTLGLGVAVLSLAAWLAARRLTVDRAGAAAIAAGGAALLLRLVLATAALVQHGMALPWTLLAADAVQSAGFTMILAWPTAGLMARRRRALRGW